MWDDVMVIFAGTSIDGVLWALCCQSSVLYDIGAGVFVVFYFDCVVDCVADVCGDIAARIVIIADVDIAITITISHCIHMASIANHTLIATHPTIIQRFNIITLANTQSIIIRRIIINGKHCSNIASAV